jgi:CHASE3 domain sensor protein
MDQEAYRSAALTATQRHPPGTLHSWTRDAARTPSILQGLIWHDRPPCHHRAAPGPPTPHRHMPAPTSRLQDFRTPLFYLSLLLLAGVGVATVLGVRNLTRSNAWVEHTYDVIHDVEAVEATLRTSESTARGYRLTGHRALEAEYLATLPQARQALETLVQATADHPAQQQRATEVRALAGAHLDELQRLLEVQNAQNAAAAQAEMDVETSVERMQRVSALTRGMHAEELRLLEQRHASSAASVQLLLAFVVLGIGLALVLLWTMIRSLARENHRGRELEREARESIVRLEEARALSERLSEQRRALSVYAGLLQSCQNLDESMELTASTLKQLVPHAGGRCYVGRASGNFFETAADFGREVIASSDLLRNEDCWALRRGQPHHSDGSEGRMRCAHLDAGTSRPASRPSACR